MAGAAVQESGVAAPTPRVIHDKGLRIWLTCPGAEKGDVLQLGPPRDIEVRVIGPELLGNGEPRDHVLVCEVLPDYLPRRAFRVDTWDSLHGENGPLMHSDEELAAKAQASIAGQVPEPGTERP